jgi:MFS family permease
MKKVFPILALAMFSSNLGMGIVAPLLSIYAQEMGASGVWIGLVMSCYAIANIPSTPLFGRLSDRRGRKIFLVIGLFLYALISVGYIFALNIATLGLVRFLHGAVAGMVLPIALAYVGDLSPRGEEGKWMGYSSAAFYSGFGAGPLIGGVMSEYLGMTSAFIFMAALNFFAFLVVFFFLPKVEPRNVNAPAKPRVSYRKIFSSRTVQGLFSNQVTGAVGQGSFSTFAPLFAATLGLSLTLIGILISATMSLMSLLGPLGGLLADRFSKRFLVVIGACCIAAALLLIPSSSGFLVMLFLAIFMAIGSGFVGPSISALSVTEGRKFGMGSTMGLVNMGMNVGFAVGPIIAGKTVDYGGVEYAFYFGGLVVLLGIIPFFLLTRPQSEVSTAISLKEQAERSSVEKEP